MSYLPRQAVVIVHGIGEQAPLATLRSFVGGVVTDHHGLFGAPDRMSTRSDARRYQVQWDQTKDAPWLDAVARIPGLTVRRDVTALTDFYEFYWAYRFRDTAWSDVRGWLQRLLRRPRRALSTTRLAGTPDFAWGPLACWVLATTTLLATVAVQGGWGQLGDAWPALLAGLALLGAGIGWADRLGTIVFARSVIGSVLTVLVALLVLPLEADTSVAANVGIVAGIVGAVASAVPLLSGLLVGFVLGGVGDAARYLTPKPRNVGEIDTIRSDMVELLRRLHEASDPFDGSYYERVVVVGHSLGSVIAFDGLRLYWNRVNRQLRFRAPAGNGTGDGTGDGAGEVTSDELLRTARCDAAVAAEEATGRLHTASHEVRAAAPSDPAGVTARHGAQEAFWRAQRGLFDAIAAEGPDDLTAEVDGRAVPPRWLVSDFVTLGSPLAHAELLMASDAADMYALAADRTWPTSPPQVQRTNQRRPLRFRLETVDGQEITAPHQAALFAATHWTNVYFDRDPIGGPVAPVFGWGVRDVCLGKPHRSVVSDLTSRSHSAYWKLRRDDNALAQLRSIAGRKPRVVVGLAAPPSKALRAGLAACIEDGDTAPDAGRLEIEVRFCPDGWTPGGDTPQYQRLPLGNGAGCSLGSLPALVDAVDPDGRDRHVILALSPNAIEPAEGTEPAA